jgi:hypothetical protein
MADGSAPENDHQQMSSEGGFAAIEERRKSPPRDAKYKMADGSAPENDHQQMSSEGGNARSNNNQQRLKGEAQPGGLRSGLLRGTQQPAHP